MPVYLVEIVADGELAPWELERIELVAGSTLEAAAELTQLRLNTEVATPVTVSVRTPRHAA